MSDLFNPESAQETDKSDHESRSAGESSSSGESAGALLKQAREAAGLHIAALAVLLKVPVKKLEALESNRLDLLPGAVFVRALACSVCRTLKIDPEPILQGLPQSHIPDLHHQEGGINAPFRAAGNQPGPSVWTQISHPAVLAGMVLLLGALVLIFFPRTPKSQNEEVSAALITATQQNSSLVPAIASSAAPETVASAAVVAPVVQAASAPLTALPTPTSANLAPPAPAPASIAVPPPATASVAAVPVTTPAATTKTVPNLVPSPELGSGQMLQLTASGTSWVAVTDAKGTFVFRRALNAGEAVTISGIAPLSVVIGRADVVKAQVRGKSFDLAAFSQGTVARFEVK